MVTYPKYSPKMVNPRDMLRNAEEEKEEEEEDFCIRFSGRPFTAAYAIAVWQTSLVTGLLFA